jgi:hypothetical protein
LVRKSKESNNAMPVEGEQRISSPIEKQESPKQQQEVIIENDEMDEQYASDTDDDIHEPTNTTYDYSGQRLGLCFWMTLIIMGLAFVAFFVLSPLMSFLAFLSIIPAVLCFIILFIFKRRTISLELSFEMFWSGMLSVVVIFIIELSCLVVFVFLFVTLGLIQTPDTKDKNAVFGLLKQENFGFVPSILFTLLQSFVVASLIEESTKYFLVFRIAREESSKDRIFYNTGPESAMIYSAISALGLATLENVGYVLLSSWNEQQVLQNEHMSQMSTFLSSLESGVLVALARGIMAIPVHVLTGALIGLFFYKYSNQNMRTINGSIRFRFLHIIWLPFLLHGIYDFVLMSAQHANPNLFMFAFAFASVMVMILILIVWRQHYVLNQRWRLSTSATVLRDIVIDDDDDSDIETPMKTIERELPDQLPRTLPQVNDEETSHKT